MSNSEGLYHYTTNINILIQNLLYVKKRNVGFGVNNNKNICIYNFLPGNVA